MIQRWWHPFQRRAAGGNEAETELAAAVDALVAEVPIPALALHPDGHIPLLRLRYLFNAAGLRATEDWNHLARSTADTGAPIRALHPLGACLDDFIQEDLEPVEREVTLHEIVGILCMNQANGKATFNVLRAPEYMRLTYPEDTLGPLSHEQYQRLSEAIQNEGHCFAADGRLALYYQSWDGAYIVANNGAAHRLALWLRLQTGAQVKLLPPSVQQTTAPARVTSFHINPAAWQLLRDEYEIFFLCHTTALATANASTVITDLGIALWHEELREYQPDGKCRLAALVVPRLHPDRPAWQNRQLARLLTWAHPLPALGRYLAERAALHAGRATPLRL